MFLVPGKAGVCRGVSGIYGEGEMTAILRLTPKQYADLDARYDAWIAPKAPTIAITGRKVEKMNISAPVHEAKKRSKGEEALECALKAARAPAWRAEYRFDQSRRWRADFAWPEACLLVEVEGGSWVSGRHNRGKGFEADCEKYAEAVIQGWRVLRFTTEMVEDGRALGLIMRALA